MTTKWEYVALSELLTERNERPSDNDILMGKLSIIDKIGFNHGTIKLRDMITTNTKMILIRPGDLVLSNINAAKGAIAIYDESNNLPIMATIHYTAYTPNKSKVNVKYLWWLLRSQLFRDLLMEYVPGGIKTELNAKRFLPINVPIPPVYEQQLIVNKLEELATRIEQARVIRHNIEIDTEKLIRSVVTNKDAELRAKAPLISLESLASQEKGAFRSGPFGSSLLHSEFVSEGIPAIGIQDVRENYFELTRKWNVTEQKADELKNYTIKPGDVLVTVMGTLGRACTVPEDIPRLISTKHVWTITLDKNRCIPKWVSYWLNYSQIVRDDLLSQGTGTAIPGLNGKKLRSVMLPDVPIIEQQLIVNELDALCVKINMLKNVENEASKKIDSLLPRILKQVFSEDVYV